MFKIVKRAASIVECDKCGEATVKQEIKAIQKQTESLKTFRKGLEENDQECCEHNERDHGICLDCGDEQDPGEAIDRATDYFEGDR